MKSGQFQVFQVTLFREGLMVQKSALIVLVVAVFTCSAANALDISEYLEKLEPSKNAGKTGMYQCDTQNGTYKYFLCVPSTYSENRPAGIHIFFHGQNGQGGAKWFGNVKELFLEKYNLIGINMQYNDGDNQKDTQGKVEAAKYAIAQTMLDYKIVAGRGVVTSFSGGGLPHGQFFSAYGTGGKSRGVNWPFTHMSLYSSNFRNSLSSIIPMTIYVAVGEQEWGLANLGNDGKGRASEALNAMNRQGAADVWFEVTPGKGHKVLKEDIALASEMFARADAVYAPFIYMKDYEDDKTLSQIAQAFNDRQFARGMKALGRILKRKTIDPELKAKAEKLNTEVQKKLQEIMTFIKGLAGKDIPLAAQYGKLLMTQLRGLPEYRDFSKIMAGVQKEKTFRTEIMAQDKFIKSFGSFFGGGPRLDDTAAEKIEEIKKDSSQTSTVGRLMTAYLKLAKGKTQEEKGKVKK